LFRYFFIFFLLIFVFTGCRKVAKTDMRSLVPNDAIFFIESDDLSKTLGSITKNKALKELSAQTKDFSFLNNIQMAIAVNSFEASENKINEENSVLDFKPRFVAVAETHLWNWQAISLIENHLHKFILAKFGAETEFKKFTKDAGRWFEWTAKDDRKAFVFVIGGRIYFANDKDSILKCLSVSGGKTESLKINESLGKAYAEKPENNVAFGYISPNGIAEIANFISIPVAFGATENEVGRNFIISVVPKILENTTREVFWTATESDGKITDNFSINVKKDYDYFLTTTFSASTKIDSNLLRFVPADILTVTRYNLLNHSEAWRNLMAMIAKNAGSQNGKFFLRLSNNLLNSYAVTDADGFLAAVDSNILTLRFDAENKKSALLAVVRDSDKIKKSITDQINFRIPPKVFNNAEIWESKAENISAAFTENYLILGDSASVYQCLLAKTGGRNFTQNLFYEQFSKSQATSVTFGTEANRAKSLSAVLGGDFIANQEAVNYYLTETSQSEKGIERKTVSDFGLIGTILENLK